MQKQVKGDPVKYVSILIEKRKDEKEGKIQKSLKQSHSFHNGKCTNTDNGKLTIEI